MFISVIESTLSFHKDTLKAQHFIDIYVNSREVFIMTASFWCCMEWQESYLITIYYLQYYACYITAICVQVGRSTKR